MQEIQKSREELRSWLDMANRMARGYGRIGPNDPEDIAQEAMLKLLKRKDMESPTSGWLYMVIRSAAYDALRLEGKEMRSAVNFDDLQVCEQADYGSSVWNGEHIDHCNEYDPGLRTQLNIVLSKLGRSLRESLVLRAQGCSYEEISEVTRINIGTVRSRLNRARKIAQQVLAELA